jgi:RND superfamily putative drug exporter
MPIILMAVLFGLAMDYEVFLVSRMHEEYARSGDPERAVSQGFRASARVVAAAALIMVAVFASFIPDGDATLKPIAFALAAGVLLDAFLVRMTLVPAVLALTRYRAWWLPRWLDRMLPNLDVEGAQLTRPGEEHGPVPVKMVR